MTTRNVSAMALTVGLGLLTMACSDRKKSSPDKSATPSRQAERRPVPEPRVVEPRADEDDQDNEDDGKPPRKNLNCKQGCEKLRTLAVAQDDKVLLTTPTKARALARKRMEKARAALVTRCNKECTKSPILAACMTHGDTLKHVAGCLSTPKAPPTTTKAVAATKKRCAAFLGGVKAKTGCDKLAGLLTEVALAFGKVSNSKEMPEADEAAIKRCIDTSVDVGKKQCKGHRPFKVAAARLLVAVFKN